MATKIKETPILYGKDAKRFIEAMYNPKGCTCTERIRKNFDKMNAIAKF